MIKVSAYLAMAFAAFLAIAEVARNWGDWQWAPFWIVDYLAAGLLAVGGWQYLRQGTVRWLAGAWGFTSAMFYMSFFSHVDSLRRATDGHTGPIEESHLTIIIGALMVIVFFGFVLALIGKR